MECTQLRLIAVKKANSVILYFLCKASAELVQLQEMQTSGELANIIRETFNEMLSGAQVITLRTTLCDEDLVRDGGFVTSSTAVSLSVNTIKSYCI